MPGVIEGARGVGRSLPPGGPGRLPASSADLLGSPLSLDTSWYVENPDQDWENSLGRYALFRAIRAAVEDEVGAMLDQCGDTLLEYRHRVSGDCQMRPVRCCDRQRCVTCGVGYGLGKGEELLSLFRTLFDGSLLASTPSVKAFALVYTVPASISARLDGLVARRHVGPLRDALADLTGAIKASCEEWLGSGVGIKVHWHWWHSSDPLSGPHWHAHVLIPNLHRRPDGSFSILRARGKVSLVALEELRRIWSDRVRSSRCVRKWGESIPDALTVDYRFLTSWSGRHSVAHRSRYDARHVWQDVEKFVEAAGLPDPGGFGWFLDRLQVLQGVQLARSLGWLSNAKAKKLGLRREDVDDQFDRVPGVVFRLDHDSFDATGVRVVRVNLTMGTRSVEHWPRELVNLEPTIHAKRYVWAQCPDPGGGVSA